MHRLGDRHRSESLMSPDRIADRFTISYNTTPGLISTQATNNPSTGLQSMTLLISPETHLSAVLPVTTKDGWGKRTTEL